MKQYYYSDGQQQIGPISKEDLKLKGITKETLVWCDGLNEWTKAGSVDDLADLFPNIPTPPPIANVNKQNIPPLNQAMSGQTTSSQNQNVITITNATTPTSQTSVRVVNGNTMKSKGVAYFLWLISIFGWLGFHRFYIGKIGTGILWIITGGLFGIGALFDLFTLGGKVDMYNTNQELSTIRSATMANITK